MNDDNNKIDLSSLKNLNFEDKEVEALLHLYDAILTLSTREELHKFFVDLWSPNELCSMVHRWQIVELISEGKRYEEIIELLSPDKNSTSTEADNDKSDKTRSRTRVSSATISRVKNCYNNPEGGYRTALSRLNKE